MFPYVEHPVLDLGFYRLEAFVVLVALAIVTEFQIVVRRAPHHGIDRASAASLLGWAIGLGIVSAHVFDVIAYYNIRDALSVILHFGPKQGAYNSERVGNPTFWPDQITFYDMRGTYVKAES